MPHPGTAAHATGQEPVGGPEEAVEHVRVARAAPPVDHTLVHVCDDAVLERGRHRLLDRDVHVLAAARSPASPERQQRADRAGDPRQVVRLLARRGQRRAVGVSAEGHHPAEGDRGEIGPRPAGARAGQAERGDGHLDEPGLRGGERRVADTERVEAAGWRGVDQDVGVRREVTEPRAAALVLQVQDDRALPRVRVGEGQAVWRGLAERVAARRLDPEHLRAEPHEQAPAEHPRGVGEVEHSQREPRVTVPSRRSGGGWRR